MYITRYLTFNRAFLGNPIKYCVSLKIRRSSRIVNNLFVVPSTQIKLIVSATDFIDLNSSKKLLVSKLDSVGNLLWILVRCEQSSRLKQSFFIDQFEGLILKQFHENGVFQFICQLIMVID